MFEYFFLEKKRKVDAPSPTPPKVCIYRIKKEIKPFILKFPTCIFCCLLYTSDAADE